MLAFATALTGTMYRMVLRRLEEEVAVLWPDFGAVLVHEPRQSVKVPADEVGRLTLLM